MKKMYNLHFIFTFCLAISCIKYIKGQHEEEPCLSSRYEELGLFEKIAEMSNMMQTMVDRLDKLEKGKSNRHSDPLMVSDMEVGGWEMIFRGISGNGQDVYKAWTTGHGTCQDKPSKMERSYSCHYRNSLISNWPNLGIKYVKFAFYNTFREVAYVIFNGNGSSMTNWFDKSRLVNSSWPDLTPTSTTNFFSLFGDLNLPKADRRFYINRQYNGCPGDLGHIAVINTAVGSPICHMDNHASYPQFLYSKINSVDFWERRMFGTADFLAIFLKF